MKRNPKVHVAILSAKTIFIMIFFYYQDLKFPTETMNFFGEHSILELGIILVPLGFIVGFGSWYLSKLISMKIALFLFNRHKKFIFYFDKDSKKLGTKEYFLGKNEDYLQRDRTIVTSFMGFAVVTFIVVSTSGFLFDYSLPELFKKLTDIESNYFYYMALTIGFLSPLMVVLVLPIHLLETSNLRLLTRHKDGTQSVASPFKILYGIGTLITAGMLFYLAYSHFFPSQGWGGVFMVTAVLLLVWLPFYMITFLYSYRSEVSLTNTFRSILSEKYKVPKRSVDLVP